MLLSAFDAEADALYLTLIPGAEVARTEELDGWAYVDVDQFGRAIGIEVIHPDREWPVREAIRRYNITGADRVMLEFLFPRPEDNRVRGFTSPRPHRSTSSQMVCIA